jgi:hypothetical protein
MFLVSAVRMTLSLPNCIRKLRNTVLPFRSHRDAVRASGVRPEYALIDLASGKPFGQASYLNIDPAAGSIEVGGIVYAPAFQRRCPV